MSLHRASLRALALAVAACLAVLGCAGAPPSAEPEAMAVPLLVRAPVVGAEACMAALATGTLAADPRHGLGLRGPDGRLTSISWPFGYSAVRVGDGPILLLLHGRTVAVEGDAVELGGGFGRDESVFFSCGSPIDVVPGR